MCMKPTTKTIALDTYFAATFGIDRNAAVMQGVCSCCGGDATTFDDNLSAKEYTISGLCQDCQNIAFAPDDEDVWTDVE